MQLSDREIQNTLDLLKKKKWMDKEESGVPEAEELEGIDEVVKQISEMPEIRQDKVEKLKKAIESSRYNITGDDVAKKLIGRIFSDKIH